MRVWGFAEQVPEQPEQEHVIEALTECFVRKGSPQGRYAQPLVFTERKKPFSVGVWSHLITYEGLEWGLDKP